MKFAAALTCAAIVTIADAGVKPRLEPIVSRDLRHDLSPPLWLIRPVDDRPTASGPHEPLPFPKAERKMRVTLPAPVIAKDAEDPFWPAPLGMMPTPLLTFPGIANRNGVSPPDTNGDVGPNHYVQWVNLSYAVWNKSGTLLYGPVNGNTIWQGFGGTCETRNNGDPIALYDPIADRWILSQLAFIDYNDYHQCIAISQTADPTGAWYRYDFLYSTTLLNDYPKFGVWPDAYYLAVNQFQGPSRAWAGQGVMAFERDKMLAGLPAQTIYFDLFGVNPNYGGAIPADLDGPKLPPAGAPNPYLEMDDDSFGWTPIDRLSLWNFHVDWTTPANATFGIAGDPDQVIDVGAAGYPFDSDLCGYGACIPLPGGATVQTLSDRLMYRLVYRNFDDRESLTVNHTVDVDGTDRAGVRWYELRKAEAAWTIHQAGTYSPDADHRWMASAAMDGAGDLAIGCSVAGASTQPGIRYAGRVPGDPAGALPQTEATLIAGGGVQTGLTRWGDYSMLSVDPTDDCTFWYTGEYYGSTSASGWETRVGSFRFPGCASCALVGRAVMTLAIEAGDTRFTWTAASNASFHDLVKGDLLTLRSTSGDFSAATTGCAADDVLGTTVLLSDPTPAPGGGFFYVLRGIGLQCRGTYDEDVASQVASRDAGIASAAGTCP